MSQALPRLFPISSIGRKKYHELANMLLEAGRLTTGSIEYLRQAAIHYSNMYGAVMDIEKNGQIIPGQNPCA